LENYYFNEHVKFLLINESDEKVEVAYEESVFELPLIGPRPPFYAHPRYTEEYPLL